MANVYYRFHLDYNKKKKKLKINYYNEKCLVLDKMIKY